MRSRRSKAARLRIHRETIRTLSDRTLAGVAGGTGFEILVVVVDYLARLPGDPNTAPKTNAWTGEPGAEAACRIIG
jgi:hypothetical protein